MPSARPSEKRRQLRAIGVNPYPGSKKLNHDQKSYVARLWRKYGELASESKEKTKTLTSKTPKTIRAAKDSGYATYKNKIIVHKEGAKHVRLTGGNIRFEFSTRKTHTVILSEKQHWQKQIDVLKNRKLGKNEYIGGRFYTNNRWHKIFKSLNELERYLVDFSPNDPNTDKTELLSHLTIIKITPDENGELGPGRAISVKRTNKNATKKRNKRR